MRSDPTQSRQQQSQPQTPLQPTLSELPLCKAAFETLWLHSSQTFQVLELGTWTHSLVFRKELDRPFKWSQGNTAGQQLWTSGLLTFMTDGKCHLPLLIYMKKAEHKITAEGFVFLSASFN